MECKFDKSLLQALIDDNIEPLELIFLSEHLKVCKGCIDDLEILYSIDQSLKSLFSDDIKYTDKLSSKTELTIDNLFAQLEEEKKLKDFLNDSVKMSSLILENSSRFLGFVPGIPLLRRRISKTYKDAKKSLVIPLRKRAK